MSPPKKLEQKIEELEDKGDFETIIQPTSEGDKKEDLEEEEDEKPSLQTTIKKIKGAQAPLTLNLIRNNIGEAGAKLLAQSLKEVRFPLKLNLIENKIGDAGAGLLAEGIKEARVPLTLDLAHNNIGEAGAKFLAEAIKEVRFPLRLNLGYNKIREAGTKFFAQSLKEARVPITLDLSWNWNWKGIWIGMGMEMGEVGAKFLAEAIKEARVPLTLYLNGNSIGEAGAELLVQSLKVARIPLVLNFDKNNDIEAVRESLAYALEDNFIIDARSDPSKFLSRIEFSLSMRMLEQALGFPSVLLKLVQGYIDDDELAWIEVAAIRAIEGASHENKYARINYELLTAAYLTPLSVDVAPGLAQAGEQMEANEQDERNMLPQSSYSSSSSRSRNRKRGSGYPVMELLEEEQSYNASSIGDGGAPGLSSSSSSSSSSSYGSPPGGGGGAAQSEEFVDKQATAIGYLCAGSINLAQVKQDNNVQDTSESENLLKKLMTWIKDIPEDLQQHILSSFSIQQLLKFLETTLNPDKFIEDQLNSQSAQKKFEEKHQLHGNFTGASQGYAQSNIDLPIYLDEYTGEQLNRDILVDPDSVKIYWNGD